MSGVGSSTLKIKAIQHAPLRVDRVSLKVVDGPHAGVQVAITAAEFSIGTHQSNELVLHDDRSVSRFHCQVILTDKGTIIRDMGSVNGTRVNRVLLKEGYLEDGSRIQLGETAIEVTLGDGKTEIELSPDESFGAAVGRSVQMRRVFALARQAAQSDATVLMQGETGTGKGVLARAIHDESNRSSGPFVVFDAAAVPATLIESVLFGHERGAFTGAETTRPGVFEQASGGTLFLDEIGELSLALQPKLLRVLEASHVTRIGSCEEVPVDVRVIAATNRDLRQIIDTEFRSDLYFRLAVLVLESPPLRERSEDVNILCAHFMEQILQRLEIELPEIDAGLFDRLKKRPWPGNAREVRNTLERAAAIAGEGCLRRGDLRELVELCQRPERLGTTLSPLDLAREQFDKTYLSELISATEGDVGRAATIAQIHPKSLTRLLRRHQIKRS